ncbi:hypothetical protein GQ53DRAFT_468986 [Thozetella sp. PMI_491]|nr:hypothetical protein GQ53DRAFT_468986 [Thozetella sp. PMI_491]
MARGPKRSPAWCLPGTCVAWAGTTVAWAGPGRTHLGCLERIGTALTSSHVPSCILAAWCFFRVVRWGTRGRGGLELLSPSHSTAHPPQGPLPVGSSSPRSPVCPQRARERLNAAVRQLGEGVQ